MTSPRPCLSGIYRYVRHSDLLQFLTLGWTPVADLGPTHGEWSSLMWFCCGDCYDHEPPTPRRVAPQRSKPMSSADTELVELIQQLKSIPEPHANIAKLARDMLIEQYIAIIKLRIEIRSTPKDRSDA